MQYLYYSTKIRKSSMSIIDSLLKGPSSQGTLHEQPLVIVWESYAIGSTYFEILIKMITH